MTDVTVQLEDLEALVFSTGVIKGIEGALAAFHRDPFSHPKIPLSEAHNRLASAMRNATRAQANTLINWDEPLTDAELQLLRKVSTATAEEGWLYIAPEDKAPKRGLPMSLIDQLACQGCVIIGQTVSGVVWSDDPRPALRPDAGCAAHITARGLQKLEASKQAG